MNNLASSPQSRWDTSEWWGTYPVKANGLLWVLLWVRINGPFYSVPYPATLLSVIQSTPQAPAIIMYSISLMT